MKNGTKKRKKEGLTDQLMIRLYPKEKNVVENLVENVTIDGFFKKYESVSHFCRCGIINLIQIEQSKNTRNKDEKPIKKAINLCINCKNPISKNTRKHGFKRGFVCNDCFFSANSSDTEKWNEMNEIQPKS